jgi:hypothetical protein
MTDTPKKLVVNIATGKQEYLDLTAEEIAQREVDAAAAVAKKAEEDAKAASDAVAKDALLTKLGITADEAKLLLA